MGLHVPPVTWSRALPSPGRDGIKAELRVVQSHSANHFGQNKVGVRGWFWAERKAPNCMAAARLSDHRWQTDRRTPTVRVFPVNLTPGADAKK